MNLDRITDGGFRLWKFDDPSNIINKFEIVRDESDRVTFQISDGQIFCFNKLQKIRPHPRFAHGPRAVFSAEEIMLANPRNIQIMPKHQLGYQFGGIMPGQE